VSEKAKLIRGDPPKIALKRRGSPLKRRRVDISFHSPPLDIYINAHFYYYLILLLDINEKSEH
jgi:hypothetical protein